MTLNFQMRREDVLAFSREYHAASPTYQRTRTRVRFMLPVIMLCLWLFVLATSGFKWISTIIYLGVALLWFILYPARFDRRVQRYAEKTIDEPSYSKSLGPCELTLSEAGLHSKTNSGESTFYWSAVDRVLLTDSYCFIFLTGPIGYPIPIADVGLEAAKDAYDYALAHRATTA
ncbi:MAG: YcxB family protein [Prosthecobacter sp.]